MYAEMFLVLSATLAAPGPPAEAPPATFPTFTAPGAQDVLDTMRGLYWHHYPGSGPKATMWDEWLGNPSLWPAVEGEPGMESMRAAWREALLNRIIAPEGYVATHQHASIAHQLGWPFPFYRQGRDTWGWFFSLPDLAPTWHASEARDQEGWGIENGDDGGIVDGFWVVTATGPDMHLTTPPIEFIDPFQAPFLQLRWQADNMIGAQPYIQWATRDNPAFTPDRRVFFDLPEGPDTNFIDIPMFHHPKWEGEVIRLRIGFANDAPGAVARIKSIVTVMDTRHNNNNAVFTRGSAIYFNWTGDLMFLREQINRMRRALRYAIDEFQIEEKGLVYTTWVGHSGKSGHRRPADEGGPDLIHGEGIGDNYWDLMPFGGEDLYATIRYYNAFRMMADIEEAIRANPGWNVPLGDLAFEPDYLRDLAARLKDTGNERFWNEETGRFYAARDIIDGTGYDYGYTFLNAEAVYYDFATEEHAEQILAWLSGDRLVEGDTSQGEDIYHWVFGPRSSTLRNTEYYVWVWSNPHHIPFGGQVQDGGAVLGFAYHDLMARIAVLGPENAAQRLAVTAKWFDDVQAAGGYRTYYEDHPEATLQGGGTAGGLGLDFEFFESVLVPTVVLDGFMGFSATPTGCHLAPVVPASWGRLTIDRVRLRDMVLRLEADGNSARLEVTAMAGAGVLPVEVSWDPAEWTLQDAQGLFEPASEPGRALLTQEAGAAVELARAR